MARYRRAREVVLQVLYGQELNPDLGPQNNMITERVKNDMDEERYAHRLLDGIHLGQADLDARISAVLQNWKLERLAVTDRNVLRIGVFELLYTSEPAAIIINEAIEIAKEFGDKKSGGFVNAVLDKIRLNIEAERGRKAQSEE